ncbi:hypothetical protein J2S03_001795 [Alicyclobacillus cycloheptanicus]|uniref:Uncharacterized protein n=1 Tax=Alicyclobacillus cycloheptanicus TaxID=1457 RepID=A0ABT9XIA8_9BACL|nr:hypothetical protein [Alicyclobacillus cycloheptanicus]
MLGWKRKHPREFHRISAHNVDEPYIVAPLHPP